MDEPTKDSIKLQRWVRVDAGDGTKTPVEFSRVLDQVSQHYDDPWAVLRDALYGQPIRCTFASYYVEA